MSFVPPQRREKRNSARSSLGHPLEFCGENDGIPVSEPSATSLKESLTTRLLMRPMNYYNGGGSASCIQAELNPASNRQTRETLLPNQGFSGKLFFANQLVESFFRPARATYQPHCDRLDIFSSHQSHFSGASTKIRGILSTMPSKMLEPECSFDSLPELLRCTEDTESPSPVPASRRSNLFFRPPQKSRPKVTHNFKTLVANGHQGADTYSPRNSNTMTMPRPIDHEFELYDGAQPVSSPSRQKSQSIMIKRSRGCDNSPVNSTENMYDSATWRMYHRITSARKNRVASMRPMLNDHEGTSVSATKASIDSALKNLDDDSLLSIDYSHLGEVFEIDL